MMNNFDTLKKESDDLIHYKEHIDKFIDEFGLLDFRKFKEAILQTI